MICWQKFAWKPLHSCICVTGILHLQSELLLSYQETQRAAIFGGFCHRFKTLITRHARLEKQHSFSSVCQQTESIKGGLLGVRGSRIANGPNSLCSINVRIRRHPTQSEFRAASRDTEEVAGQRPEAAECWWQNKPVGFWKPRTFLLSPERALGSRCPWSTPRAAPPGFRGLQRSFLAK